MLAPYLVRFGSWAQTRSIATENVVKIVVVAQPFRSESDFSWPDKKESRYFPVFYSLGHKRTRSVQDVMRGFISPKADSLRV